MLSKLKDNLFSIVLVLSIFIALLFTKLIPVCIGLLALIWLVKYRDLHNISSKLKWMWPFVFYALVFAVAIIFTDNEKDAIKILERHISFLVLPILIFCKDWKLSELNFFAKFYTQVVLVICVFSIVNLIYFYFTHVEFVKSMDDTYMQWKLPHLTGFHPTYFGFLIVVANILLLEPLCKGSNIMKSTSFYMAVFLSFYLLYLSPRTAIICQFIVWVWFGYQRFLKRKEFRLNRSLIIIGSVSIVVLLIFTSEYFLDKMMKAFDDKRFLLWEPALNKIQSNYFLFGEGLANGRLYLNEYITNNELTQFKGTDLHNQYLMNMLDIGIFGLLSIVLIVLRPIYLLREKSIILFMIVFSISMMSESFLYVIKGIVIFIVLSSFFTLRAEKILNSSQE